MRLFKILLAGLALSTLVMIAGCTSKVSLIDYATVETFGPNGKGIAGVVVNEEALAHAFAKAAKLNIKEEEDQEILNSYMSRVKYDISPQNNLQNGDMIVLSATFSYDNNDMVNILEGESQIKVEGLLEGEKINVFDYVDFKISGISPWATLEIVNNGHDKFFKTLKFEASKSEGLANGDEVEVKVLYDAFVAAEEMYYVTEDSKTFKVEGADEYILEESKLTEENLQGFKEKSREVLNHFVKAEILKNGEAFDSEIDQTVIATIKDKEEIAKGAGANMLVFIYKIQPSASQDIYAAVYFNNLYQDAEGTIQIEGGQGNVGIWGKDKADIEKFVITDTEDKYKVVVGS